MKRILIIILALLAILGYFIFSKQKEESANVVVNDYKNIEYVIEGNKTVPKYFGNEFKTDLNNDGREDIVFYVTNDVGGSGTFYYVVAALNTENGYVGSDGYYLGDRISPQNINLSPNPKHKNVIVANYADRLPDEPMVAEPTVGKSIYLKLDTDSMKWAIVAPDFEGESK